MIHDMADSDIGRMMDGIQFDTCEELMSFVRLFLGDEGVGLSAEDKSMILQAMDEFAARETREFSVPRRERGGSRLRGAERLEEAWADDPRPTTETKRQLATELDLTLKQVNDWFTNARKRRRVRD